MAWSYRSLVRLADASSSRRTILDDLFTAVGALDVCSGREAGIALLVCRWILSGRMQCR